MPTGLLRPTTRPESEPADQVEEPATADDVESQGRGDGATEARAAVKTRKKRAPISAGPAKGRKLHLPDDIHDRLWLLARQRRTTVSAVAVEILDKNLPRWRVEREG